MNLLASHPDVCTIGEVHQVFKGSSVRDNAWKVAAKALGNDLPVILATRQDFFSPRNWEPRPSTGRPTRQFIKWVLERAKRCSHHDHLNRYKSDGVEYRREEIRRASLLG